MAIKRVSDSYANGIQAFASARRPRSPRSPRQTATGTSPASTADSASQPAADNAGLSESDARVFDNLAADIAKARQPATPVTEQLATIDYHDIISSTVAGLNTSTKETRHAVYECARQVVLQRLARIRPALAPDVLEQERQSLEQAIELVEAKTQLAQAAEEVPSAVVSAVAAAIAPVTLNEPRPRLPQASHFPGGALRLFGVAAVLCLILFGYWLVAGKPELETAVTYLPKLRGLPGEQQQGAAPQTIAAAANLPQAVAETRDPPAETRAIDPAPAERLAAAPSEDRPQINQYAGCGSGSCAEPPGSPWLPINTNSAPSRPDAQPTAPAAARPARETAAVAAARGTSSSNAIAAYDRGMAQAKSGEPDRAIRDFTDAIRADPKFSDAYLQRGNMRFRNGNADNAIVDFTDAVTIDPRNAAAFKARGMASLYVGREDRGLEDLTKAIQLAEADASTLSASEIFFARRSRAGIFSRKRMDDRELSDLSAMIDAYWKNPELADALKTDYGMQGASTLMATIYRQRANLYVQRANNEGAIADLSHAVQLDPSRTMALVLERARIQEAAGKKDAALLDYQRVLELNPKIEEAKQAVARLKPAAKTATGSPAYGFEGTPFFRGQ